MKIKAFNVTKSVLGRGDAHEIGENGKEIGKLQHPIMDNVYMGIIIWDDLPFVPVACMSDRFIIGTETTAELTSELYRNLAGYEMLMDSTILQGQAGIVEFHSPNLFHDYTQEKS